MHYFIVLVEFRSAVAIVSRRRAHGVFFTIGVLAFAAGAREAAATNKWAGGCDAATDYCASFRLRDLSPDGSMRQMTACCGREGCCCHSCGECAPGALGCCDNCCDDPYLDAPADNVCCSVSGEGGAGTACHTGAPPAGLCPGTGVVITRVTLVDGAMNTVATLCDDTTPPNDCPDNCDDTPITRIWTFGNGPGDVLTLAGMVALDSGAYDILVQGTVSGSPLGAGNGLLLDFEHRPKPEKRPLPAVGATGLMIGSGLLLVAGIGVFRHRRKQLANLGR